MINRRNFIKVVTGFFGGVFAAFGAKVEGSKSPKMRPVTNKDRKDYCIDRLCRQCAFRDDAGDSCAINSWKETSVLTADKVQEARDNLPYYPEPILTATEIQWRREELIKRLSNPPQISDDRFVEELLDQCHGCT